jgi:hypothetical protein
MDIHRQSPVLLGLTDVLDSCYASVTALLLGAREPEEQRLLQMLDDHYKTLSDQVDGVLVADWKTSVDEETRTSLDYMAGLSLAWLHAKKRAASGDPITTPGFPVPPAPDYQWPAVTVPAQFSTLDYVKRSTGVIQGGHDIDLFGVENDVHVDKPPVYPPTLPTTGLPSLVTDDKFIPVTDTDGDVDTGIDLGWGNEYEITTTGTITAPEFLAQPSDANGWYLVEDARFPLHVGIDPINAHKYALLGRLGGYFFAGTARPRASFLYRNKLRLYLRVNIDDQTKGSGDGRFLVRVKVWRAESPNCTAVRAEIKNLQGAIQNLEKARAGLNPRTDFEAIAEINGFIHDDEKLLAKALAHKTEVGCL